MPEGDTVWRTAHRLDQALSGETITLSDFRFPEIATADLRGAATIDVVSRGKHLLHRVDSGLTIHSHLRMEGQWRVERVADTARWLRRADLRAAVGTRTWSALGLRLGMLEIVPTSREGDVVGHLGPDVLGPDWDPERAVANVLASGTVIGAALLDQRVLAGVGTLWASESLFIERVGPWTPASEVGPARVEALVARIHRLMDASRHHAVQSSTGVRRRGEEHYVHARSGRACRRCGGPVRVSMIGPAGRERTMFYCPACQGGMAPGDDGRAQRPLGSSGGRSNPYRRA
ncbi:DNA-formamidopyrimidine glycosylase family protein [Knoellia aerolata]|uniref:DNA-(apurinic or apyrimidinic site) lyase n=1 Tax=Knoellia aerolata DSM 18566 TaxID=1385519 RepID=A0A0A0K1A0_9MICO|nr:DNA-formamidopyrimidine glycosylase family protein [Knoellia aerolata]KGN42092.1 DNA glycosylase [Knoellia aerolata DSM 18566]